MFVEMIFGVVDGVRCGEMYGVIENLFLVYFEVVKKSRKLYVIFKSSIEIKL